MRENILQNGSSLYCDLYHFAMAQAAYEDGRHNDFQVSEAFFRKLPFGGGYLVAAGMGEFLEWADNWQVSADDVDYLAEQRGTDGKPLFHKDFLAFIKGKKLEVSVAGVPEGEIVFPDEPVLSVSGPSWQVDLTEAAFLNIFNAQSLVATKAARLVGAAASDGVNRPVLEFGLRRAQDIGGFMPARAAFIGGCAGTSNVAAGKYYDIPVKGTMAHSFVMRYEDETEAFKAFLRSGQNNATLLVDTYDTRQGIKNAIKASRETGIALQGIRIDSGDLAYWYREARSLLSAAGMPQVKTVASNDLDEHIVENIIMVQQAKYDIIAAGTKLVTAYDTPALGGVFKLKEINGQPKMKIAEGKTTIPGATNVLRTLHDGMYNGDVIVPAEDVFRGEGGLRQNLSSFRLRRKEDKPKIFVKGTEAYPLLKPMIIHGKVVADDIDYSLQKIRQSTMDNLQRLGAEYKRLVNPHQYGVGLEAGINSLQQAMIEEYQAKAF